jgi:hypothetical protein
MAKRGRQQAGSACQHHRTACQGWCGPQGHNGLSAPTAEGKAAIEVFPITGKKLVAAAGAAGLSAATIPTLLVERDNKPGLGYAIAQMIAVGGINIAFFVAQVIGKKFAAVVGFETEDDAKKAAPLIKKTAKSTGA